MHSSPSLGPPLHVLPGSHSSPHCITCPKLLKVGRLGCVSLSPQYSSLHSLEHPSPSSVFPSSHSSTPFVPPGPQRSPHTGSCPGVQVGGGFGHVSSVNLQALHFPASILQGPFSPQSLSFVQLEPSPQQMPSERSSCSSHSSRLRS